VNELRTGKNAMVCALFINMGSIYDKSRL